MIERYHPLVSRLILIGGIGSIALLTVSMSGCKENVQITDSQATVRALEKQYKEEKKLADLDLTKTAISQQIDELHATPTLVRTPSIVLTKTATVTPTETPTLTKTLTAAEVKGTEMTGAVIKELADREEKRLPQARPTESTPLAVGAPSVISTPLGSVSEGKEGSESPWGTVLTDVLIFGTGVAVGANRKKIWNFGPLRRTREWVRDRVG